MKIAKYLLRSLLASYPLWLMAPSFSDAAFAQNEDIDIEGARRAVSAAESAERSAEINASNYYYNTYIPAKEATDAKNTVYQAAASRYNEINSRVLSYQQQVTAAQNRISEAKNQQQSLRDRIRNLDSADSRLNSEINSLRNERVRIQGDIRELETRILNEESKPVEQRDQNLIAQLRSQRDQKYNRRDQVENEITQAQDTISQNGISRNNHFREIDSLNTTISIAQSDQRSAQSNVDALQGEWNARRSERDAAYSSYQSAKSDSDSKYSTYESYYYNPWQEAKRRTKSARNYLATVEANYNRERNRVISAATKAGQTAGQEEAKLSAGTTGGKNGAADGAKNGDKLGTEDARLVSYARGYKIGRETAATAPNLKASYEQGFASGINLANEKAREEDFAKGYNELLSSTLNSPSSQTETIDMEDDRTPAEVDPGSLLQTDPKSVGSVSAPSGQFPQEPKEQYPSPTDISITVPDPTYSESKPSCDTQRRPEFIQICKDNYRTAYSSGYQGSYRELYTAQYRASFASSAKEAYIKARNAAHPESTEQGLQTGAVDQGLLNGYAQRYPSAASEAFASGKASFVARRTLSYRPIVRSAKLVESVNDGIFLPGEPVQLQIVLDNIGLKGVAAGDLKVEIKTTKGLKDVSTMERLLPEMQAATLLTLNNVVKGTIDGTLSGSPLLVDGILSRKVGENFEELAQFNISASLRFPIELSKVDISTRLSLNAWVNVPFTFTNPSSQKSSERTVFLSSAPTSIEINNPRGVKIPGIEPGQTKTINIAIRPGVWVGEGQNIDFVAKIIGQGDQVIGTQNLTKAISINRSAALIPVDTSNKPVPSARFKVRAGGRATVSLLYRYLDKQNQRMGPFQVSALTSSDPRIGIALNTPISYNFGAAYPNQQDQKLTFTYNIPADLKGRSVWVAAELKEGGSVWQRQQIWLDVE